VPLESLEGIQLTFWHAFPSPLTELLNAQVAKFNGDNPWGITVRAEKQANYPDLFEATSSALSTPVRPAVVAALPEHIRAWEAEGEVADLDPYFSDPENGYTPEEQADFPAAFLAQDRLGERLLGMPAQRSARLLFYNETWGRLLDFSGPPLSAADFTRQACAANASFHRDSDQGNDGYGGWIVDTDYQSVLAWIYANEGLSTATTDTLSIRIRTRRHSNTSRNSTTPTAPGFPPIPQPMTSSPRGRRCSPAAISQSWTRSLRPSPGPRPTLPRTAGR
jgi:ABC-type glycerol-3-phosphate transport system substrate-binding protein